MKNVEKLTLDEVTHEDMRAFAFLHADGRLLSNVPFEFTSDIDDLGEYVAFTSRIYTVPTALVARPSYANAFDVYFPAKRSRPEKLGCLAYLIELLGPEARVSWVQEEN